MTSEHFPGCARLAVSIVGQSILDVALFRWLACMVYIAFTASELTAQPRKSLRLIGADVHEGKKPFVTLVDNS